MLVKWDPVACMWNMRHGIQLIAVSAPKRKSHFDKIFVIDALEIVKITISSAACVKMLSKCRFRFNTVVYLTDPNV